ncbi:MAG: hypothetical protein LWY06_04015 [Firmicutes bacterium]|nr:hypothetical protein [Bacillota bacterium]
MNKMEHRIYKYIGEDMPSSFDGVFIDEDVFYKLAAILTVEGNEYKLEGEDDHIIDFLKEMLEKDGKKEIDYCVFGWQKAHISDEKFSFALYYFFSSYSPCFNGGYTSDFSINNDGKWRPIPVHSREEAEKLQEEWRKAMEARKVT